VKMADDMVFLHAAVTEAKASIGARLLAQPARACVHAGPYLVPRTHALRVPSPVSRFVSCCTKSCALFLSHCRCYVPFTHAHAVPVVGFPRVGVQALVLLIIEERRILAELKKAIEVRPHLLTRPHPAVVFSSTTPVPRLLACGRQPDLPTCSGTLMFHTHRPSPLLFTRALEPHPPRLHRVTGVRPHLAPPS
jgi:hypothetical protein